MENIKLILLDLDGTLLDGESKLPHNFDKVVNKLYEKGIRVGVASGRNYSSIKYVFPNSFNKMVAITCNGANIYVDDKEIYRKNLKQTSIQKIINITKSLNNASYQLLLSDSMICESGDYYKDLFNKHGYNARWEKDIDNHLDDILMPTVHCDNYPNGFTDKYEELKDEVNFASSWYNCIDFMPKGISKGEGTKVACDYLKIKTSEVMAIGDQDNDLEILMTAGYPVAMKNGNENVKRIAKDITDKTNLENGALDYIVDKLL